MVTRIIEIEPNKDVYWRWLNDEELLILAAVSAPDNQYHTVLKLYAYDIHTNKLSPSMIIGNTIFFGGSDASLQFDITDDNHYLAFVNEGPIVFNLFDEISTTYRPTVISYQASYGGEAYFSNNNEWIIAYENGFYAGGYSFVRYSNVMRVDGSIQRDFPDKVYWLPQNVNVDAIPEIFTPRPGQGLQSNKWIFWLDWSPDGDQILSSNQNLYERDNVGDILVWDISTRTSETVFEALPDTQRAHWQINDNGIYEPVMTDKADYMDWSAYEFVAISPDERQVVVNQNPHPIILDTQTEEIIFEFATYNWLIDANFSPDGHYFAGGTLWDNVYIWDTGNTLI